MTAWGVTGKREKGRIKENGKGKREKKTMKRGILTILVLLLGTLPAFGNSIGLHLKEADLVLAGTLHKEQARDSHFDIYSVSGVEVIRGELPADDFRIVYPKTLDYHVTLEDGKRTLLFLREVDTDIGLEFIGTLYIAFAADLGAVTLKGDEGDLLVEATRAQAALVSAAPAQKAVVLAGLLRTALEPGRPRFLQSVAIDAIRTPGAVARLDSADRSRLLSRYRDSLPCSELKRCLLDALGEARPEGLTEELVKTVRSFEGGYHRDQIAAILAGTDCDNAIGSLVGGFEEIEAEAVRDNVLYVLGKMGRGRGVPAIRSVMNLRLRGVQKAAVEALFADRTSAAVVALGEIASGKWESRDVEAAISRLASINTREARSTLMRISANDRLRVSAREKAAVLLGRLSK